MRPETSRSQGQSGGCQGGTYKKALQSLSVGWCWGAQPAVNLGAMQARSF